LKREAEVKPKAEEVIKVDLTKVEKLVKSEKLETGVNLNESDANGSTNVTESLARGIVRWPKDRVLQMRLEQLCHCVEKNEWPSIRHSFFSSSLSGAVASNPSVTTADSSPRAISPGSHSSVSREPTPQQTPDNTPRRESLSPLPEYFYLGEGSNSMVSEKIFDYTFKLSLLNFF